MAKIKTYKFSIKDQDYAININCTSKGVFTAYLPREVFTALNLQPELKEDSLEALEKALRDNILRYKEANTHQELFIAVKYGAKGELAKNEKGDPLFTGYRNKFSFDSHISYHDNILALSYHVILKETVDGNESWYKTEFGKPYSTHEGEDHWYKNGQFWSLDEYVIIPYTEQAVALLDNVIEKMRQASETLYTFISQDPKILAEQIPQLKALL